MKYEVLTAKQIARTYFVTTPRSMLIEAVDEFVTNTTPHQSFTELGAIQSR